MRGHLILYLAFLPAENEGDGGVDTAAGHTPQEVFRGRIAFSNQLLFAELIENCCVDNE